MPDPTTSKKKSVKFPIKFKCTCGAKFRWLSEAREHLKTTRGGQHTVTNVTGQYVEGLKI